jgi:hypothetical protein
MPGDSADGNNGDGEGKFRFEAGGDSCDTCQALDGAIFQYCPELPHADCQCNIVPVNAGQNRWRMETWQSSRDRGQLTLYVLIEVECCDGSSSETVVDLEFTLKMDELAEKHHLESDEDIDAYLLELEESIIGGVTDQAETFLAEFCKNAECGENIS